MKKIINLILALMLISSIVYSQGIFNINNIHTVSVFSPSSTAKLTIDLSPINTTNNLLDLVSVSKISYSRGDWNLNNGNGTFGLLNNFYQTASSNSLNDVLFVKLRDNASQKDVVVLKSDASNYYYEVNVHQNTNNTIGSVVYQSMPGSGNYTNMDAGKFNYQDTREDVVIASNSDVKIYLGVGDGTLLQTPYSFSFPAATKVMLKQITDKNILAFQNSSSDRDEIITSNGNILRIYKNDNNNGFQPNPMLVYDAGFEIKDFEVTDLNNDGYNDIVIVGNGVAKGFINFRGEQIQVNSPIWNVTGSWTNTKIASADLDKDGLNDLVIVGTECFTSVFLNSNLSVVSQQFMPSFAAPNDYVNDIKLGDIYNQGGIGLFISYNGGRFVNGVEEHWNRIKLINATNFQTNPAPPSIKGATQIDGSFLRPMILLDKMGERDFLRYQIYKKKTGWADFQLIPGTYTGDYFIDYSEYIIYADDGPIYTDENCWYRVKTVDTDNRLSPYSNQVGYTVGIASCANCVSDNSSGNDNTIKFDKYSITNFPNPFNPVTKILYTVPKSGNVRITIFNSLGKEIKTLVNESKSIGSHIIEFNGSELSSGVYYYKIEAGSFVQTGRMLLIK